MSKYNDKKANFLMILDGFQSNEVNIPPLIKELDSYKIGLCKIEILNDIYHLYVRRPGLLIGKKGETISRIKKELKHNIYIHEITLEHDEE